MKKLLFLLLLIISTICQSQSMKWLVKQVSGEVSVLDFTTSPPTLGPFITTFGLGGEEEINIMTDINNNILFSTACNSSNIIQVRDANFNLMPNGSIRGNQSSLESAICKVPCSNNEYYFFNYKGPVGQDSLFYSIIDMNLNGGLGNLSQKNIYIGSGCTEGITISHQMRNGCRWLIVPGYSGNNLTVNAFKISHDGISSPILLDSQPMVNTIISPREIELSMDNSKLTLSTFSAGNVDPDIICYSFDLENGSVFNKQLFSVSPNWVLGIEFSPDESKIYYQTNTSNPGTSTLGRVNLTTGANEIIDNSRDQYQSDPELAGNGKIYVAGNFTNNYLSEISDPNNPVIGNIQYIRDAIFINSTGCRSGLINFIDGELPGTSIVPGSIDFSFAATSNCNEYVFIDSTCLGSWWEWDFGDSTYSNLENPIHQFSTSGNFNVTLRVKLCSDTLSITKSINVLNSFTLSVSPYAITCNGASVNLSANGGIDYVWSPATGLNSTTGNLVTANPFTTTTYTVTATNSSSCSSSETITVYIINSNVSIISSGAQVCSGSNIILIANTNGYGNFNWSNGSTNDSTIVTQSGIYTIQFTDSGCTDTDSIQISFYNNPTPVISTSSNAGCEGDSINLFLNNPYVIQQWYLNGFPLVNETGLNIFIGSSGNYSVNVTDSNGCTGTANIPVTFEIKPDALFNTNATSCIDSIRMVNTSVNSSIYHWYVDGILVDSVSNPYLHFASIGNHDIELIALNGNCADTLAKSIFISINPEANFYTDSSCSLTKRFHNTSANGSQYIWLSGIDTLSNQFEPIYTFSNSDIINIKLITTNLAGCSDSIEEKINVIDDVPASFKYLFDTCAKNVLLFPDYNTAFQYDWKIDNRMIRNNPNPVIKNIKSGTYNVSLTVNRGFSCEDVTVQDIEVEIPETHFYIPNTFTPNDDGLNEDFTVYGLGYCDQYDLFIYDRWGELIFETNDTGPNWNGIYKNKKVEAGVYSYLIKFDGTYLQGIINVLY
jgi:gliding motility-associated-like protein